MRLLDSCSPPSRCWINEAWICRNSVNPVILSFPLKRRCSMSPHARCEPRLAKPPLFIFLSKK